MKKSLGPKTILYPTPVLVIGSYDAGGRPNAMTAAWGGICCSNPPCVCVAIRPGRKSHANILQQQAFTVNLPSEDQVRLADYLGIASGKDTDKFLTTGLTPIRSEKVNAPLIGEFPLALECRLVKTLELGSHTLLIGEILDVIAEEFVLGPKGEILLDKIKPVIFAPETSAYYGFGQLLQKAFSTQEKDLPRGK
jgi:flavin reductase (DIM6/NTAB) family NADH-FMN oxidoreductase RutF